MFNSTIGLGASLAESAQSKCQNSWSFFRVFRVFRGPRSLPAGLVCFVDRLLRAVSLDGRGRRPFAESIGAVGEQAGVAGDVAGRPADLDPIDAGRVAESEVEAGITGGLIASPAESLGDLAAATVGDRDPR